MRGARCEVCECEVRGVCAVEVGILARRVWWSDDRGIVPMTSDDRGIVPMTVMVMLVATG